VSIEPTHAAAVCHRFRSGRLELLLIRTSDGARWSIPKGVIEAGEKAWMTAKRETLEETGWDGAISREPLATFHYLKPGSGRTVLVVAFLLELFHQPAPGEPGRQSVWLKPEQATARLRQGRDDDPKTVAELEWVIDAALARIGLPR